MSSKTEFNSKEVINQIVSCMNDLADARGVARCGFMYAMAQLVETLNQGVNANEEYYKKMIADLKNRLSRYETSDIKEVEEAEEGGLKIEFEGGENEQ